MATVTVTASTDTQLDDGTATVVEVVNTGARAAIVDPLGQHVRPGEPIRIEPEGRAVRARGDGGTTTLEVTVTVTTPPGLIGFDRLAPDVVSAIEAGGGGGVPASREIAAGAGLSGGGDLTEDREIGVVFGATAGTVTAGNDARLTDARTPTSHAASHAAAGSDPVTVAQSQVTGLSAALTALAPLASPAFTGTPTVPTATAGTSTTQAASTAFVAAAVAALVNSSPSALDTLQELAAALGNDASFATTVTNALAAKAPLASPTLTGTPTAPTATGGTNTTQVATTAFVQTAVSGVSTGGSDYYAQFLMGVR